MQTLANFRENRPDKVLLTVNPNMVIANIKQESKNILYYWYHPAILHMDNYTEFKLCMLLFEYIQYLDSMFLNHVIQQGGENFSNLKVGGWKNMFQVVKKAISIENNWIQGSNNFIVLEHPLTPNKDSQDTASVIERQWFNPQIGSIYQ